MSKQAELTRPKRRYSDEDRAATLAALDMQGGNLSSTSRETGVPLKTIAEWRDGRAPDCVADLRKEKTIALADKLESIAHQCVDLMPDRMPDASLRDLAGAMHLAVDKMRLLRGDPTAITETRQLSDVELRERLLNHYRASGLRDEDARRLVERAYEGAEAG